MINIGVVGCGYWGPKHIRVCQEIADSNMASVCDVDEKKLARVRRQYPNIKTMSCYDDFLANGIDAVIVATPVKSHFALARQALLAGKHVMIEKPITSSTREAAELIKLAEERNLVLMVGHTYQYHPAVDFLEGLIRSGELGEIYSIDADRLNLGLFRPDCNVIWDLAPHDISILLTLIDAEPTAVSARGTHHIDPNVCDSAYIEILFDNGTMGHVHVSWLHPRKIREITIVGSQKMAVYNDVSESEKIHIYDKGVSVPGNGNGSGNGNGNGRDNFAAWPPNYRYGNVVIPFLSSAEPLRLECSHFVDCIKTGQKPKSDGLIGLKVTSVLEAADKSLAEAGLRVPLNLATITA